MQSRTALRKQIYRQRRQFNCSGPLIKCFSDLTKVPEEFKKYRNEPFLLANIDTEENLVLQIFGASSDIQILQESEVWAMEGTHSKAPKPLTQIYVIGGVLEGHFLPALFC